MLETWIKAAMNDPDSYQHVQTTYVDHGDYLTIRTVYRGKNLYGGVVTERIAAEATIDGKILRFLDDN